MSKTKAKIALNAFLNGMSDSLKKQATLKFGVLVLLRSTIRPARVGRNPITGKKKHITECYVPNFRFGKALKDSVKKSFNVKRPEQYLSE